MEVVDTLGIPHLPSPEAWGVNYLFSITMDSLEGGGCRDWCLQCHWQGDTHTLRGRGGPTTELKHLRFQTYPLPSEACEELYTHKVYSSSTRLSKLPMAQGHPICVHPAYVQQSSGSLRLMRNRDG